MTSLSVSGPPGVMATSTSRIFRQRHRIGIVGVRHVLFVAVVITDVHLEGCGAMGDFFADAAEAEDAQRLAAERGGERVSASGFPQAGAQVFVGLRKLAQGVQHQRHRAVGDAVVEHVGGVGDDDAALFGGIEVDLVHADAEVGDSEFGQRIHQRGVDLARAGVGERADFRRAAFRTAARSGAVVGLWTGEFLLRISCVRGRTLATRMISVFMLQFPCLYWRQVPRHHARGGRRRRPRREEGCRRRAARGVRSTGVRYAGRLAGLADAAHRLLDHGIDLGLLVSPG